MVPTCIKQHLSSIWSSKLSNTEAELKKLIAYKKKRVHVLHESWTLLFAFWLQLLMV